MKKEVRKTKSYDIQMETGMFPGKKIDELTEFIINKFAEEKLNRDEGVEVLENVKRIIGEVAVVQHIEME